MIAQLPSARVENLCPFVAGTGASAAQRTVLSLPYRLSLKPLRRLALR